MTKKNHNLTVLVAFLWFLLIVVGYYVTHKPITPEQTMLFVSHLWKILIPVWVIILAGGIGYKFLESQKLSKSIGYYLQVGIGLGFLSISVLVIGSLWKINLLIIVLLLILFSFLFFNATRQWIQEFFFQQRKTRVTLSGFYIIIFSLIGIILLTQLLTSLAPAIRYDALNYHLTLPKAYLLQEKITDLPWLVMSGMPQLSEMIYLILLSLAGESAVLVFNWLIGALILFGLKNFLENKICPKSAWIGVISLIGGYTFASVLSWGYVDLMAAFFGLGFVILFEHVWLQSDRITTLLAGIFSGLAFGCKYPAGVIFLAGLIGLVILQLKTKNKNWVKNLILYCLGAGALALPWLLKNFLFTGNPIYPFFFVSGSMNAMRQQVYQGLLPYGNLLDLFFLPIRATIMGVDGGHGYSVSTGPLLLGLGVIAFLDWNKKSTGDKSSITATGIIAASGLIIWAVGNQFSGYLIQTRFYFVLFPAFAILAAYGYDQISNFNLGKVRIRRLVNSLIILILIFNSFQLVTEMVRSEVLNNVFGFSSNQEYLEKNLGWYARAVSDVNSLEKDDKVLFLYEPRGYGCITKCDPDEILDQWKVDYHSYSSQKEILSSWQNRGFTHILVYSQGMEFLRENEDPHHPINELDALDTFLANLNLVEDYGGWYRLFKIPN